MKYRKKGNVVTVTNFSNGIKLTETGKWLKVCNIPTVINPSSPIYANCLDGSNDKASIKISDGELTAYTFASTTVGYFSVTYIV